MIGNRQAMSCVLFAASAVFFFVLGFAINALILRGSPC